MWKIMAESQLVRMAMHNNLKLIVIFFLLIGLVRPIEPILSIHRAGRMSKMLVATSTYNDSFGDIFDRELSGMQKEKNPVVSVDLNSNKALENSTQNIEESYTRVDALFYALISASLVGLSGIFPLLIFSSMKNQPNLHEGENSKSLNRLLSFAVGGLLGDVFLHLLPESWDHLSFVNEDGSHNHWPAVGNGMWVLVGLISFCMLEKMFPENEIAQDTTPEKTQDAKCTKLNSNENNNHALKKNGFAVHHKNQANCSNGVSEEDTSCHQLQKPQASNNKIKTSGYLNLLANCIDNFTHGLAVGGSFLVSRRVGVLTTLAILLHEIPHEVGDFAILLKAGFNRWEAAKMQIFTASGGLLGAAVAFLAESAKSAGDQVAWILPFTSGGFIYVSLCTVVPDILQEKSPKESAIQMAIIISAIGIMHAVSYVG